MATRAVNRKTTFNGMFYAGMVLEMSVQKLLIWFRSAKYDGTKAKNSLF
jgi:hypothetical protein